MDNEIVLDELTRAARESFQRVLERDDAPMVIEAFLADKCSFIIRKGALIVVPHAEFDATPVPGLYL